MVLCANDTWSPCLVICLVWCILEVKYVKLECIFMIVTWSFFVYAMHVHDDWGSIFCSVGQKESVLLTLFMKYLSSISRKCDFID